MRLLLTSLIFILVFSGSLKSQTQDIQKPKLIVRVVVEQMRYEMLLRYWNKFEKDGGFRKMVNQGISCKNASLGYAITERSSGFATISTGTDPSGHGVIADYWYDRLTDKNIFSVEDMEFEPVGSKTDNGETGYSPQKLFSTTFGDELKMMNEKSKVYSVSLNPVSSVLGNGKLSDGAFWFHDKNGNWITSSYYMDSLPVWTREFNEKGLQEIYMNKYWHKLMPDSNYTMSFPDENEAEEGFLLLYQKKFPYNLSTLKNKSRSYKYLKYTPFGNTYTKDFALSLIKNENLGKDNHTDLLSLSFSSSSYVNEIFGPRSIEMEDLFLRLDQQLKHLLTFIDEELGRENVLVLLTADRGCSDPKEYRTMKGLSSKKFNPGQGITLLNSYLSIIYEEGNWIKAYANRQLYLNHGLIDQRGYDIERFREQIARFMVKKSGVLHAITASTLSNSYFSSGLFSKLQKSYHPKRSGDILLALEPGTSEYPKSTGSSFSYDNHIPLIWYGMDIKKGVSTKKVHLKDITPTLSILFNFPLPDASDGEPIKKVLDSFNQE